MFSVLTHAASKAKGSQLENGEASLQWACLHLLSGFAFLSDQLGPQWTLLSQSHVVIRVKSKLGADSICVLNLHERLCTSVKNLLISLLLDLHCLQVSQFVSVFLVCNDDVQKWWCSDCADALGSLFINANQIRLNTTVLKVITNDERIKIDKYRSISNLIFKTRHQSLDKDKA